MSTETDIYRTIEEPSPETLLKEKGSKFLGYAFPINKETEVNNHIEILKHLHKNARHFCYAYKIGADAPLYRINDDGEPSGTAGMPIYGQILSFDVTNILLVSVRYFGGTKLGVGGLITAYKQSAKLTLEASNIVEKTIDKTFTLTFDYKDTNKVMRIIKEKNITIVHQQMEMNCVLTISIRKSQAKSVLQAFESLYGVTIHE